MEVQRTINIGGIEFEQSEQDGKECEYRMGNFFKAWAAYSGILVKLAPYALQAELGISLFIYTMTLYNLLEKYTWEGVRSYHFQFHRKRVASGKSIYLSQDWRQIESELIASKCFAYPILRTTWSTSITRPTSFPRRNVELPLCEPPFPQGFSNHGTTPSHYANIPERRLLHHTAYATSGGAKGQTNTMPPASQLCHNWNYRECRTVSCCYQHLCITCGSNHKATQCLQESNSVSALGQATRANGR